MVGASQEIGTRMVNDAQTEIVALMSQDSGGLLNVTKMLATIDSIISNIKKRVDSAILICSVMKIPIHMHSNPIIQLTKPTSQSQLSTR